MLKFWKKTGLKEKPSQSTTSSPASLQTSPTSNGCCLIVNLPQGEELDALMKDETVPVTKSRLSKTLAEVFADKEAIAYLIQYLEVIGHGAMIKALLDIESFNAAIQNTSQSPNSFKGSSFKKKEIERLLSGQSCVSESSVFSEKDDPLSKNYIKPLDSLSNDYYSDSGCEEKSKSGTSSSSFYSDTKVIPSDDDLKMSSVEDKLLSKLLNSSHISENMIDAVKIFHKYFSLNAQMKVALDADIQTRLIENLKNNVNESTFTEAKEFILRAIERDHFNEFLRSEFHCKYQIDVLTSHKVLISDLLYNEAALFYLMEFLEQEGWRSGLEFWLSAGHFQTQYSVEDYDAMLAQEDAMVLYDKYFSLQATRPLHLGDRVRLSVEEAICRQEGPLPTCFDPPRCLIVRILESRFLEAFLQSQLYFKYLTELITTIQASPALCSRTRPAGGSDCSSEVSISTTNTLLVSEDVHPKKPYRRLDGLDGAAMSIELRHLYDPDSLWRRGREGLTLGRVDEMGRFETELEPEPDRKGESRITKAVKKLVNLDEDKTKEEMAWQVAAMIIKDVTNVTMAQRTTQS